MTALAHEVAALDRMLQRLRSVASRFGGMPRDLGPLSLSFRDAGGRGHRVVVLDPDALSQPRDLTLVGFFGLRREGVSATPLYSVDSQLVDDLGSYPGVVSYSSVELSDHESGNLVLATDAAVLERWQRSARHAHVSRDLAPRHYAAVRILTGLLRGGVGSSTTPDIASTRSIDYLAA